MSALDPDAMRKLIATGASSHVEQPSEAPRFAVGDRITTCNVHRRTHTRLPRFARGKTGSIVRVHGMFAWPDSRALRAGSRSQYVYAVRFDFAELWGEGEGDAVVLDIWEAYIADQ